MKTAACNSTISRVVFRFFVQRIDNLMGDYFTALVNLFSKFTS